MNKKLLLGAGVVGILGYFLIKPKQEQKASGGSSGQSYYITATPTGSYGADTTPINYNFSDLFGTDTPQSLDNPVSNVSNNVIPSTNSTSVKTKKENNITNPSKVDTNPLNNLYGSYNATTKVYTSPNGVKQSMLYTSAPKNTRIYF